MDAQEIRVLIEIFERSSLTELMLERGGARLILKREGSRAPAALSQSSLSFSSLGASLSPPLGLAEEGREKLDVDSYVVKSPLVGTFYRRPAPTEEPYVEIGDRVEKGDTVCIIEAMKVMNEIKIEQSGVVAKIFVEDGKPVEYGQPLLAIRPA